MDRKVKSFRLRVDLLAWVESYAKARDTTQVAVLETALQGFRDLDEGGVPDLPAAEAPEPAPRVRPTARAMSARDWAMDRQRKLNEAKYR